jgi:pimeloyl-ACP methyl ester carboxylesterase
MKKLVLICACFLQSSNLAAAPIHDRVSLKVGDTHVFLEISGPSRNAPLLLFLHGGPGAVTHLVMFQSTTGRQLEKDFLVAYLHQRGIGRSSPVPDSEQTIANNVEDVDRVISYLTRKYGQKQVFLVGHSWGGMLAGAYTVAHPEKVAKLVLIATALNFKQLLKDTYQADLDWAKKTNNDTAAKELVALSPSFDTPDHFYVVMSLADKAGGTAATFDFDAFVKSHHIDTDFPDWRARQGQAMGALIPGLLKLDSSEPMRDLQIPVLFVDGALDTIVGEVTMRRDYDNYQGPKSFRRLEHSHHLPFVDETDLLTEVLREFLSSSAVLTTRK